MIQKNEICPINWCIPCTRCFFVLCSDCFNTIPTDFFQDCSQLSSKSTAALSAIYIIPKSFSVLSTSITSSQGDYQEITLTAHPQVLIYSQASKYSHCKFVHFHHITAPGQPGALSLNILRSLFLLSSRTLVGLKHSANDVVNSCHSEFFVSFIMKRQSLSPKFPRVFKMSSYLSH